MQRRATIRLSLISSLFAISLAGLYGCSDALAFPRTIVEDCRSCAVDDSRSLLTSVLAPSGDWTSEVSSAQRFDMALMEVRESVQALGWSQRGVTVIQGQRITVQPPSGTLIDLTFDSEGFLKIIARGNDAIRFHRRGSVGYGFDVKSPTHGYNTFQTIMSVTYDPAGTPLSYTWHPTSTTTNFSWNSGPSPQPERVSSRDATSTLLLAKGMNGSVGGPSCEAIRNDESDENKDNWKVCRSNAQQAYESCMSNMGGALFGGGFTGALAGAGAGAVIGGLGAVPGAIIGFIGGVATGGSGVSLHCHGTLASAQANCDRLYNIELEAVKRRYRKCLARAAAVDGR